MSIGNIHCFTVYVVFTLVIVQVVHSATKPDDTVLECRRLFPNEIDDVTVVGVQNKQKSFKNIEEYYRYRNEFINNEVESSFGSDIILSKTEMLANKIIMEAKEDELKVGSLNPYLFSPSRHILEVLDVIKQSKLFKIIQKMPKGGILHAHDMAICSVDYLISLTHWPHLWQRSSNKSNEIMEFRFARMQPNNSHSNESDVDDNDVWQRVKDVRDKVGARNYDDSLRKVFTLFDKNFNPKMQFKNGDEIWKRFQKIFTIVRSFLAFAPARRAYFKTALKELQEDGVQYLEFRGGLTILHDLDGNQYPNTEILNVYTEALDEFKRENPLFIGSKFIFAQRKRKSSQRTALFFQTIRELYATFPHFLVGFDMTGQEDRAPGLVSYAEHILQLPDDIRFFFHAGETNWFGSIDENLIDAVLLGSRRIGHGYALIKHPKVMELVKSNDIAIEVNPISNQVLKLVDDYRNHPASVFMAQNVPIVISSDDPSFWEVSPLSHDFFITFLGITSQHSDLRVLKQLAINSIKYSSLNSTEKIDAFSKWQIKWDLFIDDLVHNGTIMQIGKH